jgi:hypothetical protein
VVVELLLLLLLLLGDNTIIMGYSKENGTIHKNATVQVVSRGHLGLRGTSKKSGDGDGDGDGSEEEEEDLYGCCCCCGRRFVECHSRFVVPTG